MLQARTLSLSPFLSLAHSLSLPSFNPSYTLFLSIYLSHLTFCTFSLSFFVFPLLSHPFLNNYSFSFSLSLSLSVSLALSLSLTLSLSLSLSLSVYAFPKVFLPIFANSTKIIGSTLAFDSRGLWFKSSWGSKNITSLFLSHDSHDIIRLSLRLNNPIAGHKWYM